MENWKNKIKITSLSEKNCCEYLKEIRHLQFTEIKS